MQDPPAPRPPIPTPALDRRALERVIARAAELQAHGADAPEALSEEQVLAIGADVGLDAAHLRQAIAEERTRVVVHAERGWLARWFGPGAASATRVVPGQAEGVLAALDTWMQKGEYLRLKRRFPERITWEPARDFMRGVQQLFDTSGRDFALSRVHEVAATVSAVDDGRVLVRLDADLGPTRAGRARASGIAAGTGIAAGGTIVALATLLAVPTAFAFAAVTAGAAIPVLAGAGGAYLVARQHDQLAHRTQLALEQVLDRLEHGELETRKSFGATLRGMLEGRI